jgi:hypothetical protein
VITQFVYSGANHLPSYSDAIVGAPGMDGQTIDVVDMLRGLSCPSIRNRNSADSQDA